MVGWECRACSAEQFDQPCHYALATRQGEAWRRGAPKNLKLRDCKPIIGSIRERRAKDERMRLRQGLKRSVEVVLLLAGILAGQLAVARAAAKQQGQAQAPKLAFEVATVKASAPLDMQRLAAELQSGKMPNFGARVKGLRAEYTYMTLKDLVALAYGVKDYQVTGPAWMGSAHFDVVATMPEGAKPEDAPGMLKTLLADRFKLKAHDETQEHSVLALVVAKGGPKMKEATGEAAPFDPNAPLAPGEMQMDTANGPARMTMDRQGGGATLNMGAKGTIRYGMDPQSGMLRLTSSRTTMAALADMLTQLMSQMGGAAQQVVDRTGLTGSYEVSLEFSLADMIAAARAQGMDLPAGVGANGPAATAGAKEGIAQAADPGGGSSVFRSVEALGLKLEPRKAPVEQVVVDSAEKSPAEN